MRKCFFLIGFVLCGFAVCAQQPANSQQNAHRRTEVAEIVGDLSPQQKRKVENISNASRTKVDELRKRKHIVCDSIAALMGREGDRRRELFPLFDQEAQLQVAINREMYDCKCRIDEVLTAEQRAKVRAAAPCDKKTPGKRK